MENEKKTKIFFFLEKQKKVMLIRVQNVALQTRGGFFPAARVKPIWISTVHVQTHFRVSRPLCLKNDYVKDCKRWKRERKKEKRKRLKSIKGSKVEKKKHNSRRLVLIQC